MSHYRQPSLLSHWRSALTVTAACLAWAPVGSTSPAEESEAPVLVASLSVSTIPPEPVAGSVHERPDSHVLGPVERDDRPITLRRRKTAETKAWERFELEFRPTEWSSSPVKRQLETAKYGLDTTIFALDRFVQTIRDHADFEFDHGRFRPTRASAREGFLDNPRVKLDLEMTRARPFLGVRVVIPFGN